MSDIEIIERILRRIGKKEYADKVKEVYDLVKELKDRINKIDDDDIREAALYAAIAFTIQRSHVDYAARITILEAAKFELLRKWSELDKVLEEEVWGE